MLFNKSSKLLQNEKANNYIDAMLIKKNPKKCIVHFPIHKYDTILTHSLMFMKRNKWVHLL